MSQTQLSESEQGERLSQQYAGQMSREAIAQAMLNMLHARGRQIEEKRQQKRVAEEEPAAEQKTGPESIDSTTSQSESPDTPVTR